MLVNIINTLTSAAIIIAVIKGYLVINKMWRRKHIEEVAESISVSAKLMSFLILTIYFMRATVVEGDWLMALDLSIGLGLSGFMMLVGVKFWVPGQRKALWEATVRAVRSEEKEWDNLLRGNAPPREAKIIARILYRVANLDAEVGAEERKLLDRVAEHWGVDMPTLIAEDKKTGPHDLAALDKLVQSYLSGEPNSTQVRQALDLVQRLVIADKNLSLEEDVAIAELVATMQAYIGGDTKGFHKYAACIIPQRDHQFDDVARKLGLQGTERRAGGEVYVVGEYHSRAFADAICAGYRDQNYLAVVLEG